MAGEREELRPGVMAGVSRYELLGRRENERGGVRLRPNAGGLTALYTLCEIHFVLKGVDRQFPCAEGHNSLTPDLVEIPLMGVQICTQQTRSPVKNYPLMSRPRRARESSGKSKHYIRSNAMVIKLEANPGD